MARSEFRFNKKRRHFCYLFKDVGNRRLNFLLSTKPVHLIHKKSKKNIKLSRHPDATDETELYIIPFIYIDELDSFGSDIYPWSFDRNDKRKIKRLKKKRFGYKKSQS